MSTFCFKGPVQRYKGIKHLDLQKKKKKKSVVVTKVFSFPTIDYILPAQAMVLEPAASASPESLLKG